MLFAVQFSYKIALAPLPTLFITACSKSDRTNKQICMRAIFSVLTSNLELAQKEYKAIIISNEPSAMTHDLKQAHSDNYITICCSLHFKTIDDIKEFIAKTTPGHS